VPSTNHLALPELEIIEAERLYEAEKSPAELVRDMEL
jgi:hypothetical protein